MRLHRQLFWLLVLLLPVQLGRHFWPNWTQVLGLPIDYLSPTVYLTDILVMGIFASWWWQKRKSGRKYATRDALRKCWWVGAVFLYLLTASLLAQNSAAALYKLIKISEFVFLGFYVAKEEYKIKEIRSPLAGAVIYSSLIAIVQFVKQSSINGFFWWLGERDFNLITPGIAKAIIDGRLVMRPYATFSHPNVLAGFILVSIIVISGKNRWSGVKKIWQWAALALGGITIVLSFSRSAWLVSLLVGLELVLRGWRRKKKRTLRALGLVLLLILIAILFYFAPSLSGQETIDQRLALAEIGWKMIKINSLAGVGLNNFISQLPNYWQQFGMTYWLQPVHNIFLLLAAETGLTGLIIFLWFLILTFKKLLASNRQLLITTLAIILTLGLFDHYWLTLQQTQLLFSLIFGLSWKQ